MVRRQMAQAIASAAGVAPGKGKNIALWIAQILLAGMFLMAGGSKLAGAPQMVAMFEKVGFGQWFRYLTGLLEVVSAILLVIPWLAGIGATVMVVVMIGAVIAHLTVLGGSPAIPVVLLLLSAFVAWGRNVMVQG
jgi:putative oxidoreductase